MNRYHRWYCNSGRWARRLETTIMPWVLGDTDPGAEVLEVGPGPGLTTDLLRQRGGRITSIEIDHALAEKLKARLAGTNVTVVEGDATQMPFDDGQFSGAVCMTMLHHVPAVELQDRLLREVFRVLRPGARFVGSDSTISLRFRLYHLFDTMVLVDADTFAARLEAVGFEDVSVRTGKGAFRWQATKPSGDR